MTGDLASTFDALRRPLAGLLQKATIGHPDRAEVLVDEALIPVMKAHLDDLLTIYARAYASALSIETLKAGVAFYASPAGQEFTRSEPNLLEAKLTGSTEWTNSIMPDLKNRIQEIQKAHSWGAAWFQEDSGCRINPFFAPREPARVFGKVQGIASPEEVRRRTALAELKSNAAISPDYMGFPRIIASITWGGVPTDTIAAIIDGHIPEIGETVQLEMRHRDPRFPCSFIPVIVRPH